MGRKAHDAPAMAEAGGASAQGFGPVGNSGWFQLRHLPQGSYRIVVYRRPEPGETGAGLHDRGDVHGELRVECDWPRHDLVVPWRD